MSDHNVNPNGDVEDTAQETINTADVAVDLVEDVRVDDANSSDDGGSDGDEDAEALPAVEVEADTEANHTCAVCMDDGTNEENPLLYHNCSQCAAGAWRICESCEEKLLSRECPVCRSDYAPLVMYQVPGLPLAAVLDRSLPAEQKSFLLALATVIKKLLTSVNVAVWCPSETESKMVFALLGATSESSTDQTAAATVDKSIICTVPMPADAVVDGKFNFTNKTWDAIVDQSENGAGSEGGPDGTGLPIGQAFKRIFDATGLPNAMLLVPLQPESLQAIINEAFSSFPR